MVHVMYFWLYNFNRFLHGGHVNTPAQFQSEWMNVNATCSSITRKRRQTNGLIDRWTWLNIHTFILNLSVYPTSSLRHYKYLQNVVIPCTTQQWRGVWKLLSNYILLRFISNEERNISQNYVIKNQLYYFFKFYVLADGTYKMLHLICFKCLWPNLEIYIINLQRTKDNKILFFVQMSSS